MHGYSQEPASLPQEEEEILEAAEDVDEDDEQLQQWHMFRRNPLDLNRATEAELQLLGLNAFQIIALIEHRKKFGDLIAIHELQVIKGWNPVTIRKLLPYIIVGQTRVAKDRLKKEWDQGEHLLLMRIAHTIEKSKGYLTSTGPSVYQGGPWKKLLRYRYQAVAGLQAGFTVEKDAGEKYFGRGKPFGFDFTSAHIQVKTPGLLKTLIAGDFKIQMGQGLICWQGNGFRKGAGSILVKRQGPVVLPYSSAGEFLFSRGIAAEWVKKRWSLLTYYSARKFTASIKINPQGDAEIGTINQSGLHRTNRELETRNNVFSQAFGMLARYYFPNGHLSFNAVKHFFDHHFSKGERPYQHFELEGNTIGNASMDYSFTRNNFHTSGEWAVSQSGKIAIINNVMIALDSKADLVLLHRYFEKSYASFQSGTFSDQTVPKNETGFYTGISLRPHTAWKVDAYADLSLFPWLKFRADAPSSTSGYAFIIRYLPSRKAEWYVRFRKGISETNFNTINDHFNSLTYAAASSIRIHMGLQLTREWTLRQRIELTRTGENGPARHGSLYYAEGFYKPPSGKAGYNFRVAFFNTDGYDTRIYQYEQDVLFNATVPAVDGRGIRYYFNAHRKINPKAKSGWKADVYVRFAQTIYSNRETIGSAMDELNGNIKSDWKVQLIISS